MRLTFQKTVDLLNAGHVVAVPTETVYGLAASIGHPQAIENLFTLKGRPKKNPLIVHLAAGDQLERFTKEQPSKQMLLKLIEAFWPGPLTLVLEIIPETLPAIARASLPTAAFRVPEHPLTRELIMQTGPLVMPSANLSGRPSATAPEHVEEDFGLDFPVLDGGKAKRGLESTVIKEREGCWEIIRLGAIEPTAFKPLLGYIPKVATLKAGEAPLCPGQLYRHYSPKAQLVPTLEFAQDLHGAVVGFSDRLYPLGCKLYSLGPSDAPEAVAENLYATLRRLDQENVGQAWLDMRFPNEVQGLWETIAERLLKASQK